MGLPLLNSHRKELSENTLVSEIWDWGKSLLIALVSVAVVNQFIITQCKVVGYSMQPTLLQGERLVINRLIYDFRAPHRGEVITFADPDANQPKPVKNLVKRVVAVAGDDVEVRNGLLYINGSELKESYIDIVIEDGDWGPYKVPKAQVFVLGDNRHANASRDSRIFNAVPTRLIIGRAEFVVWPLSKIREL
ncbi:MAG: signal peptidase [Bacilli bacterium]|nr:signal peptidase [Bacilli bacterium]